MRLDLIVRDARIHPAHDRLDIGIGGGRIAVVGRHVEGDCPAIEAGGALAIPGLVDTHIHLDKSRISTGSGGDGGLASAIAQVSELKRSFSEEDVYRRGARTLERAILQGTTRMRTHVELDPQIGFRGLNAVRRLKKDYAWAISLEICVFPQEGMNRQPAVKAMLESACRDGADLVGGCPYTDIDPDAHIAHIFDLAGRFDLDVDFHLDFDLNPLDMALFEVCRQAESRHWQGRVAIGHVSKLSAAPRDRFTQAAGRLREAGVAVTVLPATDLFLMGQGYEHSIPRGVAPVHLLWDAGVTCSIATNNVLNPFTPFGDCSLVRMANLYANIAQIGGKTDLGACFDMISVDAARLINADNYSIAAGNPADIVLIDAPDTAAVVSEIVPPRLGIKNGRVSFIRPDAVLNALGDEVPAARAAS